MNYAYVPNERTTVKVVRHPVSGSPVFLAFEGTDLKGWALMGARNYATNPGDLRSARKRLREGTYQELNAMDRAYAIANGREYGLVIPCTSEENRG